MSREGKQRGKPVPAGYGAARGLARRRGQRGYAMLVILVMLSVLILSLAAAVPRWKTELQREREQVEIDRAQQYVVAIKRYYKKFGSYPPNLDRLKETNGIHFLRQAWPDPLVPDGKWRFLQYSDIRRGEVVGGGPTFNGPTKANLGPGSSLPGADSDNGENGNGAAASDDDEKNPQGFDGGSQAGGTSDSDSGESGSGSGASGGASGGGASGGPGSNLFGGPTGPGNAPSPGGPAPVGPGGPAGAGFNMNPNPGAAPPQSGLGGGGQRFGGTGIMGVASRSKMHAIHAFNHKHYPYHWQFIYSPLLDRSVVGSAPAPPQGSVPPGESDSGDNGSSGSGSSGFGSSGFGSGGNNGPGGGGAPPPSPVPGPG